MDHRVPDCTVCKQNNGALSSSAVRSFRAEIECHKVEWKMLPFLKYHSGAKPGKQKRAVDESPATLAAANGKSNWVNKSTKHATAKPCAPSVPSTSTSPPPAKVLKLTSKPSERCFRKSWKDGNSWLIKNMNKVQSHTFITGCKNIKKSAVDDHCRSAAHQQAVAKEKKDSQPVEKSSAGRALLALKDKERTRMSILFRNAHAVATQNRPYRDYVWKCDLDRAKGLDIGETYINDQACAVFVDNIRYVVHKREMADLAKGKFYSITMDGSTDAATVEQEIIYIRFASVGTITTKFIRIVEPQNTTGEVLASVLEDTVTYVSQVVPDCKFVGITCDGASNMLGVRKGAVVLVKKDHPGIFLNHCLAHRLELAYKDALKKQSQYDRVLTLLIGIYYFYHKGSSQTKQMKRSFKVMGAQQVLPTRVGGTRWLSHMYRAIDRVLQAYKLIATQLASASHENAKAEGLYKLLTSTHTLVFMMLLKVHWALLSSSIYLHEYILKSLYYPQISKKWSKLSCWCH